MQARRVLGGDVAGYGIYAVSAAEAALDRSAERRTGGRLCAAGDNVRIGIDLGGTKIEAIALDDRGATLCRRRVTTPADDYSRILETIAGLVQTIERELGQSGTVGVGSPGALSLRTGLLRNSNTLVLNGQPLDRDIGRVLGRPIRLENDANCFALSEAIDGAGCGAPSVFGVILGTGVGGGMVFERRLISGLHHVAGEWGHNPIPWPKTGEWPGPACYCGKTGCIELFLSGPGLTREFRARGGRAAGVQEISAAAQAGDRAAIAALDQYQDRLARGLAAVINIFDPGAIVLGGGLSNLERFYQGLPELLARYVFSDSVETRVVRAMHGDSSGVRGAAWLWPAA